MERVFDVKVRRLVMETPGEVHELHAFSAEFSKESDRGAVLVAASHLDERLKSLIRVFLRDTNSAAKLLDGFNAPLGTFSARVSAAHALSLIEDHEFKEITLIRKIRNEFGHKWRNIGFETEKIKSLCNRLPWLGQTSVEVAQRVGRTRFNCAVLVLLTDLLYRERAVRGERRTARLWTNTTRRPKSS